METEKTTQDPSVRNFKFALVASAAIVAGGLVAGAIKETVLNEFNKSGDHPISMLAQAPDENNLITVSLESPAP
jgi:hypothetical protein